MKAFGSTSAVLQDCISGTGGAPLASDIHEVNLSYLMLARRMLHEDYEPALFRLGFSIEVADLLLQLSSAQLVKLADCGTLLCRFRFDDYTVLSALTAGLLGGILQQAHTTILLAKQPTEQIN
jgi:flagellar transcriptional activator FlhD